MSLPVTPDELKTWRFWRDVSQKQLAVYLSVTRATVNRWETGRCPTPGDLMDRLRALNVPMKVTPKNTPKMFRRERIKTMGKYKWWDRPLNQPRED